MFSFIQQLVSATPKRASDLEESRVRRLSVVLLGCVLPGDPEHGFLLIFPAQTSVFPTLYLGYQPLFHVHLRSRFHLQRCDTNVWSRSQTHVRSRSMRKDTDLWASFGQKPNLGAIVGILQPVKNYDAR